MKKHGLLFFLILIFNLPSKGQENFGIKAGVNYSGLSVANNSTLNFLNETESVLRYHTGLFAAYHIRPWLGIRSEIQYSYQGATLPETEEQFIKSADFEYLSFPFLIKLGWANQFYGEFGASFSRTINNSGFEFSNPVFNDVIFTRNSDTALLIGFSVKIHKKLWAGFRYSLGPKKRY